MADDLLVVGFDEGVQSKVQFTTSPLKWREENYELNVQNIISGAAVSHSLVDWFFYNMKKLFLFGDRYL